MQGIYRILNISNGKHYIGSSQDIEQRLKRHMNSLRKGSHINLYLQSAWNKYGEFNFVGEVVEEVKGNSNIRLAREQVYLDIGFAEKILYNIAETANYPPCFEGEAHWLFGKHHTDEVCQKMSFSHTGKKLTEEHKANIGKANMGREVTEKTRDKIGVARTGNTDGAREYLALYNNQTGEVIPSGWNFKELCQKKGLDYSSLLPIVRGENICSLDGWQLLGNKGKLKELKQRLLNYPMFYNERTGKNISSGRNLKRLCRERGLNYTIMWNIRKGITKCSMGGWRLATKSEIACFSLVR